MNTVRFCTPEESIPFITSLLRKKCEGSRSPVFIGIPGGRGAQVVIRSLLSLDDSLIGSVYLYLVDERIGDEPNEHMLMNYGLEDAISQGRFERNHLLIPSKDLQLPVKFAFDLLFLGMGEDGHFSSLFPGFYSRRDAYTGDIIEIDGSPKPPPKRLTYSFSAFSKYSRKGEVYIVFFGEGKRDAYERLLSRKESPDSLPVQFFITEGFDPVLITDLKERRVD